MRRLLDELESSLLAVREIAERRGGQVSIACIPSATAHLLPDAIREFNARFPQIRLRILDEFANDVLRSVVNGAVDLGICVMTGNEPGIEFETLLDDPFVLACRGDHPLAVGEVVTWRDVAPYRFIAVGRLTANRALLDLGLADAEWRPRWFYEVQRVSTALGLVEAGLGIAALPRLALPPGPHPDLVARTLIEPALSRRIGIIRRRGTTLPPAAQQFHDMLTARWTGTATSPTSP
jgi:DNA-binding transcriptional LysR family regulator